MGNFVKFGIYRMVVILPYIVLKFPVVRLKRSFKYFFIILRQCFDRQEKIPMWKNLSFTWRGGLRDDLLRGLQENWSEFVFYQKSKHKFLVPTYFSLFGLMNIARRGSDYGKDEIDLWWQLCELTDRYVHNDMHHFSNRENFSPEGGRLCIRDYGNEDTQDVVLKYGDRIFWNFDLNYVKPRRKK